MFSPGNVRCFICNSSHTMDDAEFNARYAAASKPMVFADSPSFDVVAKIIDPATPEFQARPYVGKTVPEGLTVYDHDSTDSDGSNSVGSNSAEEEELKEEVIRLRAELDALQPRKKRRGCFNAGSPQIRYVMRTLQGCHTTHSSQLRTHAAKSPGHAARSMLVRLLKNFMEQLDEESQCEGFDWRAVPDRPHAKRIKFIV